MPEPQIVRATDDDVLEMARRRCADEHERAIYLHVAASTRANAWVAKDDGVPIGIVMPHALDDELQIAELFVEAGYRGNGIGRALWARAVEDASDVALSACVPADSAAYAAAVRFGFALHAPLCTVAGAIPRPDELLRLAESPQRFGVEDIDVERHAYALDACDRETRGSARRADHAFFTEHASGTVFFLDAEPVGYAYVWPSGRIGPLAAASATYAERFFAFALVSLMRTYGASWCTALVPGANARVLRAALRAGLKIEPAGTLAGQRAGGDVSRYVGLAPSLF